MKDVLRESGMGQVNGSDIKQAFDEFDVDGNGTIDKTEMKDFIRTMTGI